MKKLACLIALPLLLAALAFSAAAETLPAEVTDSLAENAGHFTPYDGAWEYADGAYTQTDSLVSGSSWHYGSYFQYAYEDFTLSVRMKLNRIGDPEGYSGILFRKAKPDDTTEMSGYALALKGYGQLALYDWTKTQVIFQIPVENPYDWHEYTLEVSGRSIRVSVDGVLRQAVNNGAFPSGFLSLTTATASASFADFAIQGEPIGSADSIGQIGDGNMDKAAADAIFEQRAAVDAAENAAEPAWFTTMIGKLNGSLPLADGSYAAKPSAGGGAVYTRSEDGTFLVSGEEDGIVQRNAGSPGSPSGSRTLKITAVILLGVAAAVLLAALILFFVKGRSGKAPTATTLALVVMLTGVLYPLSAPSVQAEDPVVFDDSAYGQVFYVSPSGSDQGDGSEAAPFQSLRKAQEAVRAAAPTQQADIAVVLREGTYTLGSVLTFDERDSGCNGFDVVWMSYPGDLVRISGGVSITGWTEGEDGIWSAKTPLSEIEALFVNGERASVASSGAVPLELLLYDTQRQKILVKAEDVRGVSDGDVLLYQDWQTHILPIRSVDGVADNPTAAEITLTDPASSLFFKTAVPDLLNECTQYILQNSRALLDEPGEYYYDAAAGTLYYKPRAGEDMASADVCAPGVDGLIRIQGTSMTSPVSNLVFRGLVFECAGFVSRAADGAFQEYQATHYFTRDNGTPHPDTDIPTAALHLQNAHDIRIERSVVRRSGGSGVNFYHAVHDSTLDGCLITDISGNGVTTGVFAYGKLPGNLYLPDNPEQSAVHHIRITNNVVTWTGRQFKGGEGISNVLGYEILIRNNEVGYTSAIGIANGWGWSTRDYVVKENTIAYNDIHHAGLSTVDVAGFYNLNAQKGTQIRGNYIHDVQRAGTGRAGAPVYGIYLDEGSNWLVVTDNVCVNNYNNDINFHSTGGSIYSLGNDAYREETVKNAGVGNAYASLSLRKQPVLGHSLVRNVSLGQPTNALTGEVGMKITPNSPITVQALGRFHYAGNTGVHKLTIYQAADNAIVATAYVDMSVGRADSNGFKYAALENPVTLQAGISYYVVSEETAGGDLWLERICQVVTDGACTVDGGVTRESEAWNLPQRPGPGYMHGPVNLLFT